MFERHTTSEPSSPPQRLKRKRVEEFTDQHTPQKKVKQQTKTIEAIRSLLFGHYGILLQPPDGTSAPFAMLQQAVEETRPLSRKSALVNDINRCFKMAQEKGISYEQLANEHDKTSCTRRRI